MAKTRVAKTPALLPAKKKKKIIGWREWVKLPKLGVKRIKAKIDTGARTCALHAFKVEQFTRNGAPYVRFAVHPLQRRAKPEIACTARVVDQRHITDSGGRAENRLIIKTLLKLGKSLWPVELSLTNRDPMGFRLLIGRQAIRGRYLVDPGRAFVAREKKKKRKRA